MGKVPGRLLLIACGGAVGAGLTLLTLRPEGPAAADSAGNTAASRPSLPVPQVVSHESQAAAATAEQSPSVPLPQPASDLDVQAGSALAMSGAQLAADPASRPAELAALLRAVSIDCEFGPGGGGQWPNGKLNVHGASWQGGPIAFEAVDIEAGTAQMQGSVGATGSLDGKSEVRATAANQALHFSGITPKGELVVVSVFAKTNEPSRHLAVISRHGTQLDHESAQFYGTCDSGVR